MAQNMGHLEMMSEEEPYLSPLSGLVITAQVLMIHTLGTFQSDALEAIHANEQLAATKIDKYVSGI